MTRLELNTENLIQYGISSDMAERSSNLGLTVTKIRSLSNEDLKNKFGLSIEEAKELKTAINRQPIDGDTLNTLLERSVYTCNICHGAKGASFIVHHITPYAKTQDNDYINLIVLCPNDHDLAHGSGLSMSITAEQLKSSKEKWEGLVEKANAAKAAQSIEINDGGIDYINVHRIEELCLGIFKEIPKTSATSYLENKGIINKQGYFQEDFVRENLSGHFLFNYINSGEGIHYRELMVQISTKIKFENLSEAIDSGKRKVKSLEGKLAFFIGGVYSKIPITPIEKGSPAVTMHYTKRKIRVEWILDPNYFQSVSAIARQGTKNRYIIYCLVRTIDTDVGGGQTLIKASPFLIAQPSIHANRIPGIGWEARYGHMIDDLSTEEE